MAKATRPRRAIRFSRVPRGIAHAGAWKIERQLRNGTIVDILDIDENNWRNGKTRFEAVGWLAAQPKPRGKAIKMVAEQLVVSQRTIERWLRLYQKNPDIVSLIPRARGPRLGHRRILPERERLLRAVIDEWAKAGQRHSISWIQEECARRARAKRIPAPSRSVIQARIRDAGLEALQNRRMYPETNPPKAKPPRSSIPLEIVQIDHTLVDVMVVDELHRKSMGRPWITVAFDLATRCVLGIHLSLHAPSAVSVGMVLAMSCLPKEAWLKERQLDIEWPMQGIPKIVHLDNGSEFHSIAVTRGCDRHGMSLEYRPPGRPHFGGHIERYLGTLMGRIHGLPGTTFSNSAAKGKYKSEAHASMTIPELERWVTTEIAGRYHHYVHRGIHAVPSRVWETSVRKTPVAPVADPARFLLDFLPAETRRIGRDGFQVNRVRYWDPLLGRLFPSGTNVLVRFNPRDLSRVFVPSPDNSGYIAVPYADLRRPPITLAELERARTILVTKGDARPREDALFKAAGKLRQIEDAAARSTRRARRNRESRPALAIVPTPPPTGTKPQYDRAAKPSKGEVW